MIGISITIIQKYSYTILMINKLGLTDSVMMLGIRNDVSNLLNAFDVFYLFYQKG